MRQFAIGDIHGASLALDTLLAALQLTTDDTLIFLGDSVGRGPDTRGVLDRIIALARQLPVIHLMGNHEWMMLASRDSREEWRNWRGVGGNEALASYSPLPGRVASFDHVPQEHWDFLERGLTGYYELPDYLCVHANLDPALPLDQQPEEKLLWEFLKDQPVRHYSGKTMVCGHSTQRSGVPLVLPQTICLDTGAYRGGWLTGLELTTGIYLQADLLGRLRQGHLQDHIAS